MKNLLIILLVLGACICTTTGYGQTSSVAKKSHFYNDIDLFTLKGVSEVGENASFPYIQIEEVGSGEKNISYCSSSSKNLFRSYKKIGDYWLSTYKEIGDTGVERVYEYIQPNKIIKLYYSVGKGDKIKFLKEVSVLEKWKQVSYLVKENLVMPPGVNVPSATRKKAKYFFIEDIVIKNGVLSLYQKRVDTKNTILYKGTLCYEIGNQSYFRWAYLDENVKIIDCNK